MKINVSSILRDVKSRIETEGEISLSFVSFGGDNIKVNSPVKVKAAVENTGKDLLITGRIIADLTLRCSRCLENFTYVLETDFEEELSNKEDNNDAVRFEGDTVDLTDIVINNILLALPMKPVCREDCKGLCPHCGCNRNISKCNCTDNNIDPRLTVLKDLLKGD